MTSTKVKLTNLPLIVIAGETASGKSSVAISLAQKINGEIICADSKTVYCDMNIGTAKPTKQDQMLIKHWCLDLVKPDQEFNAAMFKEQAEKAINDIRSRKKVPILVGGSGLYINSIIYNYNFGQKKDQNERSKLDNKTVVELIKICQDNQYMLPKNQHNKRHLIRTIENRGRDVKNTTIIPNLIYVGIKNDKTKLETRIKLRIEQMLDQGLVEETKKLYQKYNQRTEAFTADIYPIVKRFLDQEIDRQQMIDLAVIKDRQLAKKQRTWFRRDQNIKWLELEQVEKYILSVLNN